MDFLNKAYGQLKDLVLSMTPATRIVTGLLLAVVVISLVFLFRFGISGGDEYLMGGRAFSVEEMERVLTAFGNAGLEKYELEGSRIKIPRGQSRAYYAAMSEGKAIPSDFNEFFDKAFQNSNPFVSREMQQARLKHAKQQELALILTKVQGIEKASVQYDIQQTSTFPRTKVGTAAVAVRPTAGTELSASQVTSVRDMVAAAVAELKPENVAVTDLNAGITWPGSSMNGDMGRGSAYAVTKKLYEKDWTDKILAVLSYIPKIKVATNVELDPQLRRTDHGSKLNPKGITAHSVERSKESSNTSPTTGGRPGSHTQSIMGSGTVTQEDAHSESTETFSEATKITDRDEYVSDKAPLIPVQVTASVGIPSEYFLVVWTQQNPPVDGQPAPEPKGTDLKRIEDEIKSQVEDTVVGLLPVIKADDDPYPQVKVTTYQSIPATELPATPTTSKALTWLGDNWSTLGMILVGLCGLVMLRSMVRSNPAPARGESASATPQLRIAQHDDEAKEEDEGEEPERALRPTFGDSGPNLKEELTEIVRDNPDTAAAILKSWIGTPA